MEEQKHLQTADIRRQRRRSSIDAQHLCSRQLIDIRVRMKIVMLAILRLLFFRNMGCCGQMGFLRITSKCKFRGSTGSMLAILWLLTGHIFFRSITSQCSGSTGRTLRMSTRQGQLLRHGVTFRNSWGPWRKRKESTALSANAWLVSSNFFRSSTAGRKK